MAPYSPLSPKKANGSGLGVAMARETKVKGKSRVRSRLGELPKPCFCCTPTLYEENRVGAPKFESGCILALSALGDERWDGCWRLSEAQEKRLLRSISTSERGAAGTLGLITGSGEVSMDQILSFARKEDNREMMQGLPKAVHGLLSEFIVQKAFRQFDADGNNRLNQAEWGTFLESLEAMHLQFLLGQAFAAARAFYARGQPWCADRALDGNPDTMPREEVCSMAGHAFEGGRKVVPRCFQVGPDPDGLVPPGWLADLHYYCANNHPLYGIVACDPNNPLSAMERLAMELATIGFTTATLAYLPDLHRKFEAVEGFESILATVASMVLWWTLFLLFTCPKLGRVDLSQSQGRGQELRARTWSALGAILGYLLLAVWVAFLCKAVWLKVQVHEDQDLNVKQTLLADVSFLDVMEKRARSYLISVAIVVTTAFNPFLAWGQTDPKKGFNPGDYIGIGQWRIEKQRFQACCAELLEGLPPGLHFIKACRGCSIS